MNSLGLSSPGGSFGDKSGSGPWHTASKQAAGKEAGRANPKVKTPGSVGNHLHPV